jgi:hypothetical protein
MHELNSAGGKKTEVLTLRGNLTAGSAHRQFQAASKKYGTGTDSPSEQGNKTGYRIS